MSRFSDLDITYRDATTTVRYFAAWWSDLLIEVLANA